ncbi:MAG: LysR substrate-binding domain-containing protein [Hyphomicrobiales bacterium]|uniref:LysR substrate-binding domain-containing protein n=1 Tax=Nisaea sp. TaxID=2024842 RepID=UPI003293BB69
MNNTNRFLPPLSRLKPFEAAARHESFSLAAADLGMTQTAVSKQISLLEKDLGIELFERRNRAVFLTDAGRQLGRVVSAALTDVATEIAVLRHQRRTNELVLHCQLCEAFYWLMPRLSRFHERYPDTELRVVSALNPLTETSEAFDVAIQTSGRKSGTAHLVFTVDDDIFPVCAPSLVQGGDCPIPLHDLAAFSLLSHSVTPQDWINWQGWLQCVGASLPKPQKVVSFDSYPLALQAAVTGQGVALGWRRTTEDLIEQGKLIKPFREFVERPTEISVFRGTARNLHPDTEFLLAWLSDEFSQ